MDHVTGMWRDESGKGDEVNVSVRDIVSQNLRFPSSALKHVKLTLALLLTLNLHLNLL